MKLRACLIVCLCWLLTTSSFADFHYEETTKITGGAIVGMMKFAGAFNKEAKRAFEPTTSTVYVKGNRMARVNATDTEIVDLDKETITHIDHEKKTYTVTTFQEMKQQIEEAQRKAEQRAKEHPQPQQPAQTPPQMSFKVNVRNTGQTKQVAGLNASESILSMEMQSADQSNPQQQGALAMTNDMWMAPEIPGYGEVRDFQRRLAIKMGMMLNAAFRPSTAALMQPGSAQGMAEMVKEMSKLKGVPVMQVMRMGATANGQPLPAASEAPLPAGNDPQMPSKGEVAEKSATSAIMGKLGGLGGFGRHRPQVTQEKTEIGQPQDNQGKQAAAQSVLMESSTELASFSSAPIEDSRFEVPAGYARVERPVRQ